VLTCIKATRLFCASTKQLSHFLKGKLAQRHSTMHQTNGLLDYQVTDYWTTGLTD